MRRGGGKGERGWRLRIAQNKPGYFGTGFVREMAEQMQSVLRCSRADFQGGDGGSTRIQDCTKSDLDRNLPRPNYQRSIHCSKTAGIVLWMTNLVVLARFGKGQAAGCCVFGSTRTRCIERLVGEWTSDFDDVMHGLATRANAIAEQCDVLPALHLMAAASHRIRAQPD